MIIKNNDYSNINTITIITITNTIRIIIIALKHSLVESNEL